MKEYIKNLNIPDYHNISFDGRYLKLSYENLYLCDDIVFNKYDTVNVIDIKKWKLNDISIKNIIVNFILIGIERNKTKPYEIQKLNDIDDIDYTNIWDFQYSDSGKVNRYLNGEGRCNY